MSLVASTPQFGNEMEDSAMQEDHLVDSAIAIDMESPKHQVLAPHGTSYGDNTGPTSFWSHSQSHETTDQLVDVEFETAVAYEDDGIEVEMTAAVPYEDNELEMAYENGQPEFNYEIEDAEVRDADVAYEEHGHEPASHFTHLEHEQPQETLAVSASEIEPSDPLPFAESAGDSSLFQGGETVDNGPPEETVASDTLGEPIPEPAGETQLADAKPVVAAELGLEEEATPEVLADTTDLHASVAPTEEKVPLRVTVAAAAEASETVVDSETLAEPYADDTHEDVNTESRYLGAAPPILLTMTSESSNPVMIALFSEPDAASIPSSSKATPEAPIVFLQHHHYLFGEPIADLLAQLRTELLHSEPEIMPPSEFEYKEAHLVVRHLQLVLTEDNIYSREISLLDLESMHRSCGLSGYLHLDFAMQPRFIDRYRAIQQAIAAQGVVNNPEPTIQETKEEEKNDNEDSAALQDQGKSPQVETEKVEQNGATESVETLPKEEGDAEEHGALEEETDEPPLPVDDGEASSWSEEQEDEAAVTSEYPAEESHAQGEWDDPREDDPEALVETSVPEEAGGDYGEDFLHEDDYVPGDLVRLEDEAEFSEDALEQPEIDEHTTDKIDESKIDDDNHENRDTEELVTKEASGTSEGHNGDVTKATNEYDDEGGAAVEQPVEYIEDDNEWDDLGYNAEPETIKDSLDSGEAPSLSHVEGNTTPERKFSEDALAGTHNLLSPPQRKRSFSEVEAEPEGNILHSPGSKKPRHL